MYPNCTYFKYSCACIGSEFMTEDFSYRHVCVCLCLVDRSFLTAVNKQGERQFAWLLFGFLYFVCLHHFHTSDLFARRLVCLFVCDCVLTLRALMNLRSPVHCVCSRQLIKRVQLAGTISVEWFQLCSQIACQRQRRNAFNRRLVDCFLLLS